MAALAFLLICSVRLCAQGLSKEDILKLHGAGLGSAVLVQQIGNDGISFEMTSETTLELKRLGLSDDVLSALLAASKNKRQPPANPTDLAARELVRQADIRNPLVRATELYREAKYASAAAELESLLAQFPSHHKARTMLIATYLRADQFPDAEREYILLRNAGESASNYVRAAEKLLNTWKSNASTKEQLLSHIAKLDTGGAFKTIDEISGSEAQKIILRSFIHAYGGHFDEAKLAIERGRSALGESVAKDILARLERRKAQYDGLRGIAEKYLHSPLGVSVCSLEWIREGKLPEMASMSVEEYVTSVASLARIAPLDNDVQTMSFHAALIKGDYEEVQKYGDLLLSANGRLSIPFYSKDTFFSLVIDARLRHVLTVPSQKAFQAAYTAKSTWTPPYYKVVSDTKVYGYTKLVPFDLAFDKIRELRQQAGGNFLQPDAGLESGAYAIRFNPGGGTAPHYSMMHFLHCTKGQVAQKTATSILGRFILHAIGESKVTAGLVEVKQTGPGLGAALISGYGAAVGAMPGGASGGAVLQAEVTKAVEQNYVIASIQKAETDPAFFDFPMYDLDMSFEELEALLRAI